MHARRHQRKYGSTGVYAGVPNLRCVPCSHPLLLLHPPLYRSYHSPYTIPYRTTVPSPRPLLSPQLPPAACKDCFTVDERTLSEKEVKGIKSEVWLCSSNTPTICDNVLPMRNFSRVTPPVLPTVIRAPPGLCSEVSTGNNLARWYFTQLLAQLAGIEFDGSVCQQPPTRGKKHWSESTPQGVLSLVPKGNAHFASDSSRSAFSVGTTFGTKSDPPSEAAARMRAGVKLASICQRCGSNDGDTVNAHMCDEGLQYMLDPMTADLQSAVGSYRKKNKEKVAHFDEVAIHLRCGNMIAHAQRMGNYGWAPFFMYKNIPTTVKSIGIITQSSRKYTWKFSKSVVSMWPLLRPRAIYGNFPTVKF